MCRALVVPDGNNDLIDDWKGTEASPEVCVFHRRLLEEEAAKRSELEQLHLRQQRVLCQTEAEKQELVAEQLEKERALQAAMTQLDQLEKERHGALQQYEVRMLAPGGPPGSETRAVY